MTTSFYFSGVTKFKRRGLRKVVHTFLNRTTCSGFFHCGTFSLSISFTWKDRPCVVPDTFPCDLQIPRPGPRCRQSTPDSPCTPKTASLTQRLFHNSGPGSTVSSRVLPLFLSTPTVLLSCGPGDFPSGRHLFPVTCYCEVGGPRVGLDDSPPPTGRPSRVRSKVLCVPTSNFRVMLKIILP